MKRTKAVIATIILFTIIFSSNVFSQDAKDINLPSPVKTGGKPLMEALNARQSAREFSAKELSMQMLSDLLWAADGINRPDVDKRTAPTAMNWQDMEVYVILRSGIYKYMAKENNLKLIKTGNYMKNAGKQDYVEKAALNLVFVSNTSKMAKATTNDDKILFAGIHTGCIVQNVYLYCASVGLNTVTRRNIDLVELKKTMELSAEYMIVTSQTIGFKP